MKKHNQLIAVIIGIVVLAMAYNYWRIFIQQDYLLADFVSCNPAKERCFRNTCEDCDDIPEYFKMIEKKAYTVKGCDKPDHNCLPFTCEKGDKTCKVVYCNEEISTIGYPCEEMD